MKFFIKHEAYRKASEKKNYVVSKDLAAKQAEKFIGYYRIEGDIDAFRNELIDWIMTGYVQLIIEEKSILLVQRPMIYPLPQIPTPCHQCMKLTRKRLCKLGHTISPDFCTDFEIEGV